MTQMKRIYIDTLNETDKLTDVQLRVLVKVKNKELDLVDEVFLELIETDDLISLIGEKNILLKTLKK